MDLDRLLESDSGREVVSGVTVTFPVETTTVSSLVIMTREAVVVSVTSVVVPSIVVGTTVVSTSLVMVEYIVMMEISGGFGGLVPVETDEVVLLYAEVVRRGLVVTVRLPVAGMLVRTVALPVVSDVDDDVVRVSLDVDSVKGVTVRFLVSEEVDSTTLDPVPVPVPLEKVLLEAGKGTVEDSPVRVADSVSVPVLDSFVLVSDEVELCPLVVVETLPVAEVEGVDATEVDEAVSEDTSVPDVALEEPVDPVVEEAVCVLVVSPP